MRSDMEDTKWNFLKRKISEKKILLEIKHKEKKNSMKLENIPGKMKCREKKTERKEPQ